MEIIIRGDPIDVSPLYPSPAQLDALRFFTENPHRKFQWQTATPARVRRMSRASLAFTGCFDNGRYPVGRRIVEVSARGPHALLFNRDWHAQRILGGSDAVPPGCLILPDFPSSAWGKTDEEQELAGSILWQAWETAGHTPALGWEFDHNGEGENSPRAAAIQTAWRLGRDLGSTPIDHLTGQW
jgi:hypothetical protein